MAETYSNCNSGASGRNQASKRRYNINGRKKSLKTEDPYPGLRKELRDAGDSAFITRSIYEEIAEQRGIAELKNEKINEDSLSHFFKKIEFYLRHIWSKQQPELKHLIVPKRDLKNLERKFEKQAKDLILTLSNPHFDRLYLDRSSYTESLEEPAASFESRCRKIRETCNATSYKAAVQCALADLLLMVKSTEKLQTGVGERSFEINKAAHGDRNKAVLYAATQANDLFSNRFPTFLVDIFHSSIVREMFPGENPLTVSGVESQLKKVARKGSVSGFNRKRNSADM